MGVRARDQTTSSTHALEVYGETLSMHFQVDFSKPGSLPEQLSWVNPLPKTELLKTGDSSGGLKVTPEAKTDFWQKTYYDPPLVRSNGHILAYEVPKPCTAQWSANVKFSLDPKQQFDQAGIMIFIDDHQWMKTGIEYVDGHPRMSCVVTNQMSDWSTQPWSGLSNIHMRVSYIRESVVVECGSGEEQLGFIRIAPLPPTQGSPPTRVGPFCCAPTGPGMTATFHTFGFSDTVDFDHHA